MGRYGLMTGWFGVGMGQNGLMTGCLEGARPFLFRIGLTLLGANKANVRARAVHEPPLQRADISGFPFSTA